MKSNLPEGIVILVILVICFILGLFDNKKRTKQTVADDYHITRPTLAKWIEHFQDDLGAEDWKKKRTLSAIEVYNLKKAFGEDASLVLTKGQIAEKATSNYKTVAENVKKNLNKIGITLQAWETCSSFPPKISKRILDMLEGDLALTA